MNQQDLDFQIQMDNKAAGGHDSAAQNYNDETPSALSPQKEVSTTTAADELHVLSLKRSSHPIAVAFHILFKITGILSFLLLNLIISAVSKENPILTFLIVILSNAFDFWIVKNITGRLLVGLRWGSEIKDDGTEVWHFESYDEKVKLNPFDKTMFWWSQYIMVVFWSIMVFFEIITLKFLWAVNAIIGLILCLSNTIGFIKCSKDHQKKMKDGIQNVGLAALRKNIEL